MGLFAYLFIGASALALITGGVEEWRIAEFKSELADIHIAQEKALESAYENGRAYQVATDAASFDVGKTVVEYRDKLQTKTIMLTKEIPVYVPMEAVRACTINRGAIELLNSSSARDPAAATIPNSSAGDISSDSHVGLDQLTASVAGNYAKCNSGFQTIDAWKDWYARAKSAYDDWASKQQMPLHH